MNLTIHTKQETAQLGDLYGLFFEDLNHAADSGLYAPMFCNVDYAVSSRDQASGDVIVKLVNVLPKQEAVTIELEDMAAASGTAYIMSGYGQEARNVLGKPETVVPREEAVSFASGTFQWTVQPESVCILRLHE